MAVDGSVLSFWETLFEILWEVDLNHQLAALTCLISCIKQWQMLASSLTPCVNVDVFFLHCHCHCPLSAQLCCFELSWENFCFLHLTMLLWRQLYCFNICRHTNALSNPLHGYRILLRCSLHFLCILRKKSRRAFSTQTLRKTTPCLDPEKLHNKWLH